MNKLFAAGVFGFVLMAGLALFPMTAGAEEATDAAMSAEDGRVIRKCPRCGEPLYLSHEHMEEEEGVPFSLGMDNAFLSKYVWRGLNVTDDPVWQPAVWASYKNFTLNVWGNMDLTDINGNDGEFNEVDITVDYSWNWDKVHCSVGAIRYEFPNTAFKGTTEAYGAVGYDMLLQPTVSVYYDFDEADGFYGTLGVAHSFEIPKIVEPVSMSLDLSAKIGVATKNWNNFYYGADHTAFVDFVTSASLPVAIGDNVTIAPTISYSTVVDKTLSSKAANDHEIIWGVVLSAEI